MTTTACQTCANRFAIERLMVDYATTVDTGDFAAFSELFRHGNWLGRSGYDEVLAWLEAHVVRYDDGLTWTQHQVSNVAIDVAPDGLSATGTCYIQVLQQPPGKPLVVVRANYYTDTFRKRDGAWQFETRNMLRRMVGDDTGHLR